MYQFLQRRSRDRHSFFIESKTIMRISYVYVAIAASTITVLAASSTRSRGLDKDSRAHIFNLVPVSGSVKDNAGEPLVGVSVVIKGSTYGTTTDVKGIYKMEVPDDAESLVFSFIGFKTVEMKIAGRTYIDVLMEEDVTTLQEVDIKSTGYWTSTRDDNTGNIVKVTTKDFEHAPLTNPLVALQGRAPGVEITPSSGVPGASMNIRIRGQNSVRTPLTSSDGIDGNLPLYIIDGIPVNSVPIKSYSASVVSGGLDPLAGLNPNDIESIEVLKDADATSIYGSRGANGVILITTKNKKYSSGVSLDFGAYQGIGIVANTVDLLNTQQYIEMRKEAIYNDGASTVDLYENPLFGPLFHPDLLLWDTTRYTDWQKYIFHNRSDIYDATLRIAGGSDRTSFSFSGGYHKETLPYPGSFFYRRITSSLSINHRALSDKLLLSFVVNYGINDHNIFDSNVFYNNALSLPPDAPPLYSENGSLNWALNSFGTGSWANPLASLKGSQSNTTNNLITNAGVSYNVTAHLSLKANLGYSYTNSDEAVIRPLISESPGIGFTGTRREGENSRNSWIIEPQLSYNRQFGQHNLKFILGASAQQALTGTMRNQGTGYTSDAVIGTLAGAPVITNQTNQTKYRYGAMFLRAGYDFKSKYYLNLTARRDGSSRFGPDNRFGNFAAAGAGWIFSRESLIAENLDFISFGKIRASYGTTGNDQIGESKYLSTYRIGTSTYHNRVSLVPTALFNADYAWEVTKKLEMATEIGIFKDHIRFEIAYFNNRSSNQLIEYQLPGTAGFPNVLANFDATIENSGWEYSINAILVDRLNLKWTASANLSKINNTLLAFPNIESSSYKNTFEIGEPLSIQQGYIYTGVDPTSGLYTFADITNDGEVTGDDITFIQPLTTRYFGGFTTNISFRGIELAILFQFSDRFANTRYFNMPGSRGNQPVKVLSRWQKEGDITNVQRYGYGGDAANAYSMYMQSDGAIENIQFIRLKSATLSYSLPSSINSHTVIKAAKVFLQGQNLLTWTDFDGIDPETLYGSPQLRMVSAGFQIGL